MVEFQSCCAKKGLSPETLGCSHKGLWTRSWSGLWILSLLPAEGVAPNLSILQNMWLFYVNVL